jgi:hypothetical protein
LSGGSFEDADSSPPDTSWRPEPSVDFGFASYLGTYLQGWHQNLVSFGIPLQLGVKLELPVVTLDLLGEASGGMGFGNLFEYHLGGTLEIFFFDKIGLGAGMGFYGNTMNLGLGIDDTGETPINYAPPVETSYYRFSLIFRGGGYRNQVKTSLYAELYGDGKWGIGIAFGRPLTG